MRETVRISLGVLRTLSEPEAAAGKHSAMIMNLEIDKKH